VAAAKEEGRRSVSKEKRGGRDEEDRGGGRREGRESVRDEEMFDSPAFSARSAILMRYCSCPKAPPCERTARASTAEVMKLGESKAKRSISARVWEKDRRGWEEEVRGAH